MVRFQRKQAQEALVVAFDSTASALGFAEAAEMSRLEGRLIPVPRALSAGCGIAWRGDPQTRADVEVLLAQEAIDDARIVVVELL